MSTDSDGDEVSMKDVTTENGSKVKNVYQNGKKKTPLNG